MNLASTLASTLTDAIISRLAGREQERQLAELRAMPGYRTGTSTVPERPHSRHYSAR